VNKELRGGVIHDDWCLQRNDGLEEKGQRVVEAKRGFLPLHHHNPQPPPPSVVSSLGHSLRCPILPSDPNLVPVLAARLSLSFPPCPSHQPMYSLRFGFRCQRRDPHPGAHG